MKNKINNILVCGSIVYDRIMNFPGKFSDHILPDKVHILNVSFTLDRLQESFGGTGGNIAYNLALLGERPKLFGVAGSDFEKYGDWLKRNNVDIKGVKIANNELTASAYIMTDRADNQIAGFYPGPKELIPPTSFIKGARFSPCQGGVRPARFALRSKAGGGGFAVKDKTPLNPPLSGGRIPSPCEGEGWGEVIAIVSPDLVARMVEYVKIFKQFKVPYIFDPGQQITELGAEELRWATNGAKALIGNDYEIEMILKKLGIKRPELGKMAEILVITKGEKGSEIYCGQKKIKIPAAKPKAVLDPTGAGDGYRAGFTKGLIQNWNLEKCGRLASVVAVYTVEKYGTQTHSFTWQKLAKRYEENYGEKL